MKSKTSFFLIILIFITLILNGEVPDEESDLVVKSSKAAWTPPYIRSSGVMKVLIIFIKFSDDILEESPITDLWPHTLNTLPSWAEDIVSPTELSEYSHPSMSGYYHEMSSEQYHVIGDVYENLYIPLHPQTYYYRLNSKGIHYVAEEIFTELDPYIDYSQYDSDGPDGIPNSGDDDGIVDMILLCFRTFSSGNLDAAGSTYSGIATLSGKYSGFPSGEFLYFDGVSIESGFPGSGTIQKDMYSLHQINTLIHEFGHYLFGSVHYAHRRWGLMDSGVGCMTGFERAKLGWISLKTPTSSFIITDAISNDDIYKIPVPGSNYSYIIENRTGSSFYDSQWLTPYGEMITPGHGLLVSRIYNDSYFSRLECADGNWDWLKSGSVYVYPFQQTSENPVYGKNELMLKGVMTTAGSKSHPDYLGDEEDVFKYNTKNTFTPCTNPPSNTISLLITNEDINGNLTIEYYPNSVFGIVSANQTWTQNTLVCGNATIESGVTITAQSDITIKENIVLTLNPGAEIRFAQGKHMNVYGSIVTQGTAANPVIFTRDDPYSTDKQYWQGIIINSGGSYTFNYVEMYGAYNGIKPNYTSGTISNSHFEQNYIGTYLYHANNTNIHNCEFIDNQYGTMASYSSNLNFQNNSYDSNDYYGIYFNRSTGTFKNNVIENNSTHGFNIDNQCDVDMNTWFEYDEDPTINNTIQNNASDGMWIGDGDIDLGTYLNIGTDFRGGFNYFNHGSGYLDIRYRGNDDMKAEANWWEDMAVDWDFGEIDTDPTANDLGYSLPKSVNGSDSYYTDDLLNKAYYLEKVDSNYVEAIDILNKAADIAPDDPIVQKIVLRLKRLYTKLSNKKGLLKNLDELYNSYPDQLIGITAYDHSVTLFADELNFDEALERSNKLTEKYSNYSKSKEKNAWALLEQGMLYIDTKGKLSNNVQAQSSFTKLLTQV
jgi:tetratricopeptide (TPR) repeat protein